MEELTGERKGREGRRKPETDDVCEDDEKKISKGRRLDESRTK